MFSHPVCSLAFVLFLQKANGLNAGALKDAIFCVIQCFLKCLECCLDKINKNAYVYMAITGENFCTSTCQSFKVIWNNLARVAAISMVSGFLLFLGKLMVCAISMGLSALILISQTEIKSALLPLVIIFLLAYSVASLFFTVFETAVDCMFLCFLIDCESNKGSEPKFATKSLHDLVARHKEASEKKASGLQTTVGGATIKVAPFPTATPQS